MNFMLAVLFLAILHCFRGNILLLSMPRGVKKENLPTKVCVTCNRPFNWRKKWEKCWNEVTTCSNSCNRQRRLLKHEARVLSSGGGDDVERDNDHEREPPEVIDEDWLAKDVTNRETRGSSQNKSTKSATGSKACDRCGKYVDTLIRCRVDATRSWKMICETCWPAVSGGVTDGDDAHPYYQYGGLWKNRRKQ